MKTLNNKIKLVRRKSHVIALLCVMLSILVRADEDGYRTFSDRGGRTFEGRLVNYEAATETVFFKRSDGIAGKIPLNRFSDADRQFITDWGAARRFQEGLELLSTVDFIAVSKKESGVSDFTKRVFDSFYEIRFINTTDVPFEKIDFEYCIFYNQGIRDDRTVNYEEGNCYGAGTVERLGPSAERVSKTRSIRLYTEGGSVGIFGTDMVSLANVRGIWLRFRTKLPSGREIEREYRSSDDELWEWSEYTFGAGMNEGAKKQTLYYTK